MEEKLIRLFAFEDIVCKINLKDFFGNVAIRFVCVVGFVPLSPGMSAGRPFAAHPLCVVRQTPDYQSRFSPCRMFSPSSQDYSTLSKSALCALQTNRVGIPNQFVFRNLTY